jgi:hypothetical protein
MIPTKKSHGKCLEINKLKIKQKYHRKSYKGKMLRKKGLSTRLIT